MSSPDPERTPVVIAVGQSIERETIVTGVDLAVRAARAALDEAEGIATSIDRLTYIAMSFSRMPGAPASQTADALGLRDVACEVTTAGGQAPQWAVTRAATEISAGSLRGTLIVGAEATRSMRAANPGAHFLSALGDGREDEERDPVVGISTNGMLGEAEIGAQLARPAEVYPLYESVVAHTAGRSPAEQREHLGALLAPFTEVAAANPFAWFHDVRSAADIARPSPENRLTAEPYTKRMNSFPNVDVGSALLVCSLAAARAAGIEEQSIFVWAGATNGDTAPTTRPELGASRPFRAATKALFEAAGVGVDDVSHFDLYSAFPSSVQIAANELGIAHDDARGLTAAGGMPFFGGPGNNYPSHAIASLVLKLREEGGLAFAHANGGFLTKHSVGLYATAPPPRGFAAADTSAAQAEIDAAALPLALEADGDARGEAGTVVYDRDGSVSSAPVIATLSDGRRAAAQAEPSQLEELAGQSLVGRTIRLQGKPPIYTLLDH